ncbi:MAG: ABC transporter substrate-binding protein [Armatimonadetes bacterium]|nr:ABC transporter substrate-binding protein [Armatimonadota bacterium]
MKRLAITLLALLVLPCAAGVAKYPTTIKDCRGKAVNIVREPKRIVSIAPSCTEILFALGLEKRVVGVTRFCNYPEAARKKPRIGDIRTSVEKVISLKPDLVLAHGFLNEEAIRSLEKHGIVVAAFDPKTLDEAMRDIRTIGLITNREKQASRIVTSMKSTIALVKKKAAVIKSRPKVLVAVQGEPLWAAGPRTFVDEMVRLAGGTNLASDAKPGFNQFSTEAAVWRKPDIVIYTTPTDRQIFSKGLWARTNAARKKRVHEVNPDLLVRPGPRLTDGLKAVARLIHPDVFAKL